MELLTTGDVERVKREVTFDKLLTGGDGGAAELLAWIVAMGAAAELGQPRAESVSYVPSVPMRCGMGGSWRAPGPRAPKRNRPLLETKCFPIEST